MARKQWRCFHCDELFISFKRAREHFGEDQRDMPACQIKSYEGHLVTYIRKLEDNLAQYRAEDSDVMRSIYTLEADHRQALIRAEEDGYGKGVRDMKSEANQREMAAGTRCDGSCSDGLPCHC